jgi:hypothetical protein
MTSNISKLDPTYQDISANNVPQQPILDKKRKMMTKIHRLLM